MKSISLNDDKKNERKESKESKDSNKNVLKESSKSIKSSISSKLSNTDLDLVIPEEIANKNLENNVDAYDKNLSMVRLKNEGTLVDYNKLKKSKGE